MDDKITAGMPERAPSLAFRVAAAVALAVGFHVLAVVVGLALFAGPIAVWASTGTGNLWLTIFGLFAGGSILVAIVPRRQRWEDPGVLVTPGSQPRLEREVEAVAAATGQPVPGRTYLTLEVNAAVTEHRGERILIIGLPLIQMLSVSELRSVLAHEFGHYAGGDLRFGRWVWQTRGAIGRTIANLTDDDGDDSAGMRMVRAPFIGYGKLFLHITTALGRRQEYAADAWAIRVAGKDAHAETLRKIHRDAEGFDAFMQAEVLPNLSMGRRPPIAAGWARFTASPTFSEVADKSLAQQLADTTESRSSHPTLAQRLAFLERYPATVPVADPVAEPATTLLEDIDAVELSMIADMAVDPSRVAAMQRVTWEEVERLLVEDARALVTEHRAALEGTTVGDLPVDGARMHHLVRAMAAGDGDVPLDVVRGWAFQLVSDAIVVALADAGWTVTAPPGEPVLLHDGDGATLNPGEVVEKARREPAAWASRAAELGVADVPLAAREAVEA